jgi:hypothetical protein
MKLLLACATTYDIVITISMWYDYRFDYDMTYLEITYMIHPPFYDIFNS